MTKYQVITESGFTEFLDYSEAEAFHSLYGIEEIKTIEFELPNPDQII